MKKVQLKLHLDFFKNSTFPSSMKNYRGLFSIFFLQYIFYFYPKNLLRFWVAFFHQVMKNHHKTTNLVKISVLKNNNLHIFFEKNYTIFFIFRTLYGQWEFIAKAKRGKEMNVLTKNQFNWYRSSGFYGNIKIYFSLYFFVKCCSVF